MWELCSFILVVACNAALREVFMHGIIYLVGLVVIILAILSLLGLR